MALIGINQPQRREKGKDTWDKIAQAFDIAQGALGTALAIPKFIQDRKLGQLGEAEKRATIGQVTEPAKQGEPGAFDVPGMGFRKPTPSLEQLLKGQKIEEYKTKSVAPTDEEYQAFIKVSPNSDIDTLKKLYPTRGELQEGYNRILGATTVKVEDPFAREKFTHEKTQEEEKKQREKAERYVPVLNQYALTSIDAKETKEAVATYQKMKKNVGTLIEMRTKYGGGTVTNREDVAKAKLIATKLLFQYKKLEALGVLSKSDLELVDKLIPTDPLELNPSGLVDQDPTMARLKELSGLADDDVDIFLTTRGFTYDPAVLNPVIGAGAVQKETAPLSDQERRRLEDLRRKKAQ